jgi:uracil-DNA glycosylase
MSFFEDLHPGWQRLLESERDLLMEIESTIEHLRAAGHNVIPHHPDIMKAFKTDPSEVKVVIVGQDPYPNAQHAMGLAFSVPIDTSPLPASLRNIFRELETDIGGTLTHGDLTGWSNAGVLLLNRTLTVEVGASASHVSLPWSYFTKTALSRLVALRPQVIALLWGSHARELRQLFDSGCSVESAHPSPLSAYRGFFGSKPFSRCNQLLELHGEKPVDWLGLLGRRNIS